MQKEMYNPMQKGKTITSMYIIKIKDCFYL